MISLSTFNLHSPQNQYSSLDDIELQNDHKSVKEEPASKTNVETVTISDTARKINESTQSGSSYEYFEQFIPTYEGFSSANIAIGVSDPGLETFSKGKSLEQVVIDARSSLDKNFKKLSEIGEAHSAGVTRVNSMMGELDRRALNAVVNDEQGVFTIEEKNMARNKMLQQQGLAMGLYNGPTNKASEFVDPFLGDSVAHFKAAIQFLDKVGDEEKGGSIEYAFQRAGVQRAYEKSSREKGEIPEDFTTKHPLLLLILQARDSASGDFEKGFTKGSIRSDDDLKNQSWFKGFENQLDNTIQSTQDLYRSKIEVSE